MIEKIYLKKWNKNGYEIYNFLSQDHLIQSRSLLNNVDIGKHGSVINSGNFKLLTEKNKKLIDEFCEKISKTYEPSMKDILKKLAPHKAHLPVKLRCSLSVLPPNSTYEVHQDTIAKVLSGVVYISEETNYGTLIHNSKTDDKPDEINWVVNKNFIFTRHHNNSWHSYKSNQNKRYTMIVNLTTDKYLYHYISEIGYFKGIYEYIKAGILKNLNLIKLILKKKFQ